MSFRQSVRLAKRIALKLDNKMTEKRLTLAHALNKLNSEYIETTGYTPNPFMMGRIVYPTMSIALNDQVIEQHNFRRRLLKDGDTITISKALPLQNIDYSQPPYVWKEPEP